jgi:Questin oxidase-like
MATTKSTPLNHLLDAGATLSPEYGDGLSSHLPMALTALSRLGADARRLRAFAAHYTQAKALQSVPPPVAWPSGDAWQGRFGDIAAWPAYRGLFRVWIAHEGIGDVLVQVLPALMRGCGGVAFHGLLRTAYALQARHADELADALAYWAARWMDLGTPAPGGSVADPAAVLRGLALPRSNERLIAHADGVQTACLWSGGECASHRCEDAAARRAPGCDALRTQRRLHDPARGDEWPGPARPAGLAGPG